jgi:hypothetical protein
LKNVNCAYTLKEAVEVVENDRSVSRGVERGVLSIKKRRDVKAYTFFKIAKAVKLWRLQWAPRVVRMKVREICTTFL